MPTDDMLLSEYIAHVQQQKRKKRMPIQMKLPVLVVASTVCAACQVEEAVLVKHRQTGLLCLACWKKTVG